MRARLTFLDEPILDKSASAKKSFFRFGHSIAKRPPHFGMARKKEAI
jgi:hypothetical protein